MFAPVIFIVAVLAVLGIVLLRSYEQNSILPGIHAVDTPESVSTVEPPTPVIVPVINTPELPVSIDEIPAVSKITVVRQMPARSQASLHPPAATAVVPEKVRPIVEKALDNAGQVAGISIGQPSATPPVQVLEPVTPPAVLPPTTP